MPKLTYCGEHEGKEYTRTTDRVYTHVVLRKHNNVWEVAGWCGRPDLTAKLVQTTSKAYNDVVAVPVHVHEQGIKPSITYYCDHNGVRYTTVTKTNVYTHAVVSRYPDRETGEDRWDVFGNWFTSLEAAEAYARATNVWSTAVERVVVPAYVKEKKRRASKRHE